MTSQTPVVPAPNLKVPSPAYPPVFVEDNGRYVVLRLGVSSPGMTRYVLLHPTEARAVGLALLKCAKEMQGSHKRPKKR